MNFYPGWDSGSEKLGLPAPLTVQHHRSCSHVRAAVINERPPSRAMVVERVLRTGSILAKALE